MSKLRESQLVAGVPLIATLWSEQQVDAGFGPQYQPP
jgi:hypothetical protein